MGQHAGEEVEREQSQYLDFVIVEDFWDSYGRANSRALKGKERWAQER